jgi:uncharacterized protein
MWTIVARIILRNRLPLAAAIVLFTGFLLWKAINVRISYDDVQMLSRNDPAFVEYEQFKETFGEDANVIVMAVHDTAFFEYEHLQAWREMCAKVKKLEGVEDLLTVTQSVFLKRNNEQKEFEIKEVFPDTLKNQAQLDSIAAFFHKLYFYKDLLYNDSSDVYLMAITLDADKLNSKVRVEMLDRVKQVVRVYEEKTGNETHFSGLPYIRTEIARMIKDELYMFIFLSVLLATFMLYLFFRSVLVAISTILIVGLSAIWTLGSMVLFNYEITVLTGLIPSLLIVIGVPNCIFMLNKYQLEYKKHGNKIKGLQRMVKRVGNAIFLTNITTAAGFGTFIITNSRVLTEFGVIASLNILGLFLITLALVPITYSFLPPPSDRQVKHLDRRIIRKIVDHLTHWAVGHRTVIYVATAIIVGLSIYGVSQIKNKGYMLDDIPKSHKLYTDLKMIEHHFGGLMPFEISIDTQKKKGVTLLENLEKTDSLYKVLATYEEFSRPMSVLNLAKFSKQAFYKYKSGDKFYTLPTKMDRSHINRYMPEETERKDLLQGFVDTNKQTFRISLQMEDVGTVRMREISQSVKTEVDSLFPPDKYKTHITGASILFFKGTSYLIRNLFISLVLAILIIISFISWMFKSARIVLVSIVPNLIPLLMTAALMGFMDIPIKISTILVFSIAFGILVDDSIHYLAKFRQELKASDWDIRHSVISALRESGVSMIYTSIILFFGFSIFIASGFGGTQSMGFLVSFTLLSAMLSNLVLLPAMLLSFEKTINSKSFSEPLIDAYDEEDDIELDELTIAGHENKNRKAEKKEGGTINYKEPNP